MVFTQAAGRRVRFPQEGTEARFSADGRTVEECSVVAGSIPAGGIQVNGMDWLGTCLAGAGTRCTGLFSPLKADVGSTPTSGFLKAHKYLGGVCTEARWLVVSGYQLQGEQS